MVPLWISEYPAKSKHWITRPKDIEAVSKPPILQKGYGTPGETRGNEKNIER
jgi:hypothetical protein